MQAQYAFFSPTDAQSGAYSWHAGTGFFGLANTTHFAIGAFSGSNGLPQGTFDEASDWDAYAAALLAKNDQFAATEGLSVVLRYCSEQYLVVGWALNDQLVADGSLGGGPATGAGVVYGGGGNDYLFAGTGSDFIDGGTGDDTLSGGEGDDTILSGSGADMVNGGDGVDTLSLIDIVGASTVTAGLTGSYTIGGDSKQVSNIENIVGGGGDDALTGLGGDNRLDGGEGDDTLVSGGGNDTLDGGAGLGADVVRAGAGDQTLGGGDGDDLLSYADVAAGVAVSLATQDGVTAQTTGAGSHILSGFEHLSGSDFADNLAGDTGANSIDGAGGDDTINGGGGDDTLAGGGGGDIVSYAGAANGVTVSLEDQGAAQVTGVGSQLLSGFANIVGTSHTDHLTGDDGANVLTSGGGGDTLAGGLGVDTVSYAGLSTGVRVDLGAQGATQDTNVGVQHLSGFENVVGGGEADQIFGDALANALFGAGGNDQLVTTGGGDDTLDGGDGYDRVLLLTGGSVTVDLTLQGVAQDTGAGGLLTLVSIEQVEGGAFADVLIGDGAANLLYGRAGDDLIRSGGGNDILDGLAGDDTVVAGAGVQVLSGGSETDTVSYADAGVGVTVSLAQDLPQATGIGSHTLFAFENLTGSSHGDGLDGDENANLLDGGGGNDRVDGADGDDTIVAGAGDQTLSGGLGFDVLSYADATGAVDVALGDPASQDVGLGQHLLSGFEQLIGSAHDDTLAGSQAADLVDGGAGADSIQGLGGDDTIRTGGGADTVDGGSGVDTLDLSGLGSSFVNVGLAGNYVIGGQAKHVSNFENVLGGAGSDSFVGGTGANALSGGGGADTLASSGGADTLDGGEGNDVVRAGIGNQTLIGGGGAHDLLTYADVGVGVFVALFTQDGTTDQGTGAGAHVLSGFEDLAGSGLADRLVGDAGANSLDGRAGADTIEGAGGDDTLIGGGGVDTVAYFSALTGVTVSLENQITAQNTGVGSQLLLGFANATGSSLADRLTGDGQDNVLDGRAGDDTLTGGLGADTLRAGTGADTVDGGDGIDTLDLGAIAGGATVTAGLNGDYLIGGETKQVRNVENIVGGNGDDALTGLGGANNLAGGGGADTLLSGGGADTLDGGEGNDVVRPGAGDQVLIGGLGIDTLSYAAASQGVAISLGVTGPQATGIGQHDIQGFEQLIGSDFGDTLGGSIGDDLIEGGWGDDSLNGGDGADTLRSITGDDTLNGGAGADNADFRFSVGAAVVTAGIDGDYQVGAATLTLIGIENIYTGAQADSLTGGAGANFLSAGGGDDTIVSGGGGDTLDGGTGNDLIRAGAGAQWLNGGGDRDTLSYVDAAMGVNVSLDENLAGMTQATGIGAHDIFGFENLTGSSHADVLTGGDSANVIDGGGGDDQIEAGDGDDTIFAGAGDQRLYGSSGDDTVSYAKVAAGVTVDLDVEGPEAWQETGVGAHALWGVDHLIGSAYGDLLIGTGLGERIDGGDGADTIVSGHGADTLSGGSDGDTVSYAGVPGGVNVDLRLQGAPQSTGSHLQVLTGFANVIGSEGADRLTGDDDDNVLTSGGGADTLAGGLGTDTVSYANTASGVVVDLSQQGGLQQVRMNDLQLLSGFENLAGSAHTDFLTGDTAANAVYGMGGNDVIHIGLGGDTLDGGDGLDRVDLLGAGTVDLTKQGELQDTGQGLVHLVGIERIAGSVGADVLIGDDQANVITGYGAADLIRSGGGADTLDGEQGDDTIFAGAGDQVLIGGDQTDLVSYADAGQGVDVSLADQGAAQDTGIGQQSLSQFENLTGSSHADVLGGDGGANLLDGHGGDDSIDAGGGSDTVIAGAGDQTLKGGAGNDTLSYAQAGAGVSVSLAAGGDQATGLGDQVVAGFETLVGSAHDDNLQGAAGANRLDGSDGDDTLNGRGGDDTLAGGDGRDLVSYFAAAAGVTVNLADQDSQNTGVGVQVLSGLEDLKGSKHSDHLTGDSGANLIFGAAGDDIINGGGGNDTLNGGGGSNTLSYASALAGVTVDLKQSTGAGQQSVSGFVNLTGSGFGDALRGDREANRLDGGGGNDTLVGAGGADTLRGGLGSDTADFSGVQAVRVDLAVSGAQDTGVGMLDILGVESLIGSSKGDVLAGDGLGNTLDGGAGDDTLVATAGADDLRGGDGFDTADFSGIGAGVVINLELGRADTGADFTDLQAIERFIGTSLGDEVFDDASGRTYDLGAGDDAIHLGGGADVVLGGDGRDFVNFFGAVAPSGVTVDLSDTFAQETGVGLAIIRGFEDLVGTAEADLLTGTTAANYIHGAGGGDTINGGGGDDTLDGGGGGTVSYASAKHGVTVRLWDHAAQATGVGSQVLNGFAHLVGSDKRDQLTGDEQHNRILGGDGADLILASSGDDTLDGGAGFDTADFGLAPLLVVADFTAGTVELLGFHQTMTGIEAFIGGDGGNRMIDDDAKRSLTGGDGADTVIAGLGADAYRGEGGRDLVDFSGLASGVGVDLAAGWATGGGSQAKTVAGFEDVIGTAASDWLRGDGGANLIQGGGGTDTINGRGGDDTLEGTATDGATLSYAGVANGVKVDTRDFGTAQDTGVGMQVLSGFMRVIGSSHDDTLVGSGRAEGLEGGLDDDWIEGSGGADTLVGGGGDDTLHGGSGADLLSSLGDGDLLSGGTQVDSFEFIDLKARNSAFITDLQSAEEIDLTGVEFTTGVDLVRVDVFSGEAGQFIVRYDAGRNATLVRFDLDGDWRWDHVITLDGGDHTAFAGFVT